MDKIEIYNHTFGVVTTFHNVPGDVRESIVKLLEALENNLGSDMYSEEEYKHGKPLAW